MKKIILIIGIILIISLALIISIVFIKDKKNEINNEYIIATLEKASELTTAKLNFTTLSEFKESDGIKFINKSEFKMIFEATARIGIDVKEIEVDTNSFTKTIYITIPEAKILDVKIDLDSIKYFDDKFLLFNVDAKEDANEANKLAEEKAKEEITKMGSLEMADNQAELLIKGILEEAIDKNYRIEFKK